MSTDLTPSGNEEVVPASPTRHRPTRSSAAGRCSLSQVPERSSWSAAGGLARRRSRGVRHGQGPAYEPWDDWRTATKGPLDLVRAAILAANPHNSQPWLFHVTQTQINLFADHRRNHRDR